MKCSEYGREIFRLVILQPNSSDHLFSMFVSTRLQTN